MNQPMTNTLLEQENLSYRGRGGTSAENRPLGFRPAFMDTETGAIHVSCFANGTPAPIHLLDGLPSELVLARDGSGRVSRVKASVVSGFVLDECFFTREEAAARRGAAIPAETWH
jgi:hypothetical protein